MDNDKSLKEEFLKLKKEVEPHIHNNSVKQKDHLQSYLYFSCYPLFSFVESIIILCEHGKFIVAESLLRSLIELHINVIYYQIAESDLRLAISVKEKFDNDIKGIKEIKMLIEKYPNLMSKNPKNLFSYSWLNKAEDWVNTQRRAVLKGNNLTENSRDLCLKDKAIKCDQAAIKNIDKGHFEKIYHVIYRNLSPSTHLNISGLNSFVDQTNGELFLFSDGNSKNHYLIQTAIDICIALTKDLYDNKVIEGVLPTSISTLEKLINTK